MDDLIKRQDVYNTIMDIFSNTDDMELAGRIAARIQMIPTAYNVDKVVKGHWIDEGMFSKCSICGNRQYGCITNYCSNCGARMEVGGVNE